MFLLLRISWNTFTKAPLVPSHRLCYRRLESWVRIWQETVWAGGGCSQRVQIPPPHRVSREYVQVSLMAQWSRTCLQMQEIQVPALCLEDPLEWEESATCSSILAWEILWTEESGWANVHGVAKSRTWLSDWAHMQVHWSRTRAKFSKENRISESSVSICFSFSDNLKVHLILIF